MVIKGGVRRDKSSVKGVEATIYLAGVPRGGGGGGISSRRGPRRFGLHHGGGSESPPPAWSSWPSLVSAPTATSTTPPVPSKHLPPG